MLKHLVLLALRTSHIREAEGVEVGEVIEGEDIITTMVKEEVEGIMEEGTQLGITMMRRIVAIRVVTTTTIIKGTTTKRKMPLKMTKLRASPQETITKREEGEGTRETMKEEGTVRKREGITKGDMRRNRVNSEKEV